LFNCFQDADDVENNDADASASATSTTWHDLLPVLALPSTSDKLRLVLDECVTSGCCLFIFAAVRKKRKHCQTIQVLEPIRFLIAGEKRWDLMF
jgi:hypothetical protein